jgi:protein fantom
MKIKELRKLLEELRDEKEISDAKALRAGSLEEVVAELRQANRSLEDKIAHLCEAPFIADSLGQHEARLLQNQLVEEREELITKVNHLQEAVRVHFSALHSLKQQASQLKEEKENAVKKLEDLKLTLQEVESGRNMLQDQLRLYSGEDGVDMESLERALTLVKRRGEAVAKLPFLEDPEGEKLVTLPAIKRQLEKYQVLNLKLTEDYERVENMLKLQSAINKDLHKELEALLRSRDKDKSDLLRKAEDFEEIALRRLDKIHVLEAQIRQYVYGLAKTSKTKGKFPTIVGGANTNAPDDDLETTFTGSDNGAALLSELIDDAGANSQGDLRHDENLLEIWVKSASVKDGILVPGSSTFVVVDFFDYESQTTSLLSGLKPQWDFATTYKVIVDDFLLRYIATDVATLELNMVS